MKKIHLSFAIIFAMITCIAIVVAAVMFCQNMENTDTSFPAYTAFIIVGIYYVIAIAIWGITWLVTYLILRCRTCKKQDKCTVAK